MKFFILILLLSSSVFASNWDELDTKTTYKLSQSFQLPQTERSGSILELVKGQKFELKEILPLANIGFEASGRAEHLAVGRAVL